MKNNRQRQAELKKRRNEAGLKRKEYWVTEEQHKKISAMLKGT